MYASGEIGVGGGLVLGGELFRGYRGFGGEFGHTTVEPDGLPCACGSRGCLETRAGLEPLLAAAGLNGDAVHARGSGKPVAELVRRAQEQDPTALAALADCGRWLGVALGTVVNLLSPQAIVLGGHFAPMTEWLAPVIAVRARDARARRQRRRPAACSPRRWAPRPRCAAPPRPSCAACSRIPRSSARASSSRRRRRGGRRRLSARPRSRPSGRWSGGRSPRCCSRRSAGRRS